MSKSIVSIGQTQYAPTITLAGATIDWSLGNIFSDTITAGKTYSFTNALDGRTIVVRIRNNSASAVTLVWPGGTLGASTSVTANTYKVFTLIKIGTSVFASSLEF